MANLLQNFIKSVSEEELLKQAKKDAKTLNLRWDIAVKTILKVLKMHPDLVPKALKPSKQDIKLNPNISLLQKWLKKYQEGLKERASITIGNTPGTISDPLVDKILTYRFKNINESMAKEIMYAHRISETIEGKIGALLEEYIQEKLYAHGWYNAWGATVNKVDFVSKEYQLLQVKNRDNTLNSSSKSVFDGTTIKVWWRMNSKNGSTFWSDLNEFTGLNKKLFDKKIKAKDLLNEQEFQKFVKKVIKKNPKLFGIDEGSPLYDGRILKLFTN